MLYGGTKTFYQFIGCGTLQASDVWAKELADAEAENRQQVKAARGAKVERDAKGPGKGKRRRDGTGDVSAPVPKAYKAKRYDEQIEGVQGFRALPPEQSMQIAIEECPLPTREEFLNCVFKARDGTEEYVRSKLPTDADFALRVKPRSREAAPAAQARAFDSLLARFKPEMSGVLKRTPVHRNAPPCRGKAT